MSVIVIDDHGLFRDALGELLAASGDLVVIGQCNYGNEAIALAADKQADIVLFGVEMPQPRIGATIKRILRISPRSKAVVLTTRVEPHLVKNLLAVGVHACLAKSASGEELLSTIHAVHHHEDLVVLSVSREILDQLGHPSPLTPRELEVLGLAARAMTNSQIASRLSITEGTVKRHLTNIYAKLGATSRIDAINKASAIGVINVPGADKTSDC